MTFTIGCARLGLTIYFVDVEGGQATLVVTPAHQTLLIDTGYAGFDDRDPKRILAAARDAGVTRIDHLLVTHFHPDHEGGAASLSAKIPIGTFIDYGSLAETGDPDLVAAYETYRRTRDKAHHVMMKAGDRLPLDGLEADIVSADRQTIAEPLSGGGQPNPACSSFQPRADDPSENSRSGGVRLRYGAFRFFDPGDLSWNQIARLVCPTNLIGEVDVYLVAHHGNGDTNVPALVAALRPRVAVVNNGPRKGGVPTVLATWRHLDSLADLWQLHQSRFERADNAPADYLANIDDGATGYWLKLTAQPDGRFTIVNARTRFQKTY